MQVIFTCFLSTLDAVCGIPIWQIAAQVFSSLFARFPAKKNPQLPAK
jgi:hypothetical protein